MEYGMQNCMMERSFRSTKKYRDPFNETELSVIFTGPDGKEKVVPCFWSGENNWRVRYTSSLVGEHSYRTICSDISDSGLHGKEGESIITGSEQFSSPTCMRTISAVFLFITPYPKIGVFATASHTGAS